MQIYLVVKYTDSKEYVTPIETGSSYVVGKGLFSLAASQPYSVKEYTLTMQMLDDVRLSEVALKIPFAESSVGTDAETYYFDNAVCTNMFVGINKIDENTNASTRDIVAVKSASGRLNLAFTKFDKHFTLFRTKNDSVAAVYSLEDREIPKNSTEVFESVSVEECGTEDFFERYTKTLADRFVRRERKYVPFGWSSWSCLYGHINEEHFRKQTALLSGLVGKNSGGLIQIDDGWQGEGSFYGNWKLGKEKYPSYDMFSADFSHENGFRYGLWMAPALICDESKAYEAQEPLINVENGEKKPLFITIYGLDLGKEEVKKLYREKLRRCIDEYGAEYFKIDFLANFLSRIAIDGSQVRYRDGYTSEIFRSFVSEFRKEVGEDVFLLACGSPIGEVCGIFDAIRTSSDITWDGMDTREDIKWWDIFRHNIQNIILRSYYDNAFITDPDGLVLRAHKTEYANDEACLSYDEARSLATAVAMSGGHILLNDEIDRLPEERIRLFTHILPPYGKAARPSDFFEYPYQTEAYVRLDGAYAVALYNTLDNECEKVLDLSRYSSGKCVLIDMWTHDVVCATRDSKVFTMRPHSAEAYLIKPLPVEGEKLFSASNFWCGYSGIEDDAKHEVVYFENEPGEGYIPYKNTAGLNLYIKNN